MKLANLDSLRAIAALIVVFFHLNGEHPAILPKLASFGWIGVDLFFVISGAVIAFSAEALYGNGEAGWKWKYTVRRFSRIYPLFFISSVIFLVVSQGFWRQPNSQIVVQILTHLTMTHSFLPTAFQGLNHVTWSLAIEVQYYILIALVIAQIRQAPTIVILGVALLIAFAWNSYVRSVFPGDEPITHFYLSQLPGRIDEFAWGVVIWRLWKTDPLRKFSASNEWLRTGVGCLTIIVGLSIFLSWTAAVSGQSNIMATFGLLIHKALGDTGVRILIGALCGLVVFGATLLPECRFPNPIESLGTISYGLYLWHPIAIILAGRFFATGIIGILAPLALTLVLSIASWNVIEVRSRRWLSKQLLN